MAVLDYDPEREIFFYPQHGMLNVPGGMSIRTPRGMAYCFRDTYPQSIIALRSFLDRNKGVGATPKAIERINAIKKVPEILQECPTSEKFIELFARAPYQHQRTAIEHIMQYPRLMLLLEQGLGKTFISYMAIRLLKEQGIPHKSLVVCPRIVLPNWVREIREFTDLSVFQYFGNPEEREECRERILSNDWDVVVTTFDMLIERASTPKHLYEKMWRGLSADTQKKYIDRWVGIEAITESEAAELSSDKTTKKHYSEVARILKKLPNNQLPITAMKHQRKDASSQNFLKGLSADCLFVDEASRCLNSDSTRSNVIEMLSCVSPRTYLLSGTLCVGRPTDLYMPSRIIDSSIFGMSWYDFKKKYCVFSPFNEKVVTGYRGVEDIKRRTDPYILSMSRDKCLDMPDRVFVERYYSLSSQQEDVYDEVVSQDMVSFVGKDRWAVTELTLQKITKLMQVVSGFMLLEDTSFTDCGTCNRLQTCVDEGIRPWHKGCIKPKTQLATRPVAEFTNGKLELLEDDLESLEGKKAIIWAWYIYDQQTIEEFLKEKGYKYVKASDPDCDKRFNEDPEIQVFLGQTRQGIGITLNAATITIYYSHGPELEARLQSMDRNYRIGQRNNVIVHDYVCPGTIEENMLHLLKHKQDVRDFMQEKVGCIYCPEFKKCEVERVSGTSECRFSRKTEQVSSKKTLKLKTLREEDTYEMDYDAGCTYV